MNWGNIAEWTQALGVWYALAIGLYEVKIKRKRIIATIDNLGSQFDQALKDAGYRGLGHEQEKMGYIERMKYLISQFEIEVKKK